MSDNGIDFQKRAKKAASLLIDAPVLMVPQAMHAANFTDAESRNPMLQQRVRRMIATMKERAPKTNVQRERALLLSFIPILRLCRQFPQVTLHQQQVWIRSH